MMEINGKPVQDLDLFFIYHSLDHRFSSGGSAVDSFMDGLHGQDLEDKGVMRNVCARVSSQLYDRIESYCAFLHISKREFVEQALIHAVQRAKPFVDEVIAHENEMRAAFEDAIDEERVSREGVTS